MTGLLRLLRSALWPAVALAGLLLLAPPLIRLLDAAALHLAASAPPPAVRGVAIGGAFRVVLRDAAVHEPPPAVGQALARLDHVLFRTLIDHPEGGHPVCRDPTDPARIRVKARYDGLVRIGLAEYRAFEGHAPWCDSRIDLVYLTDLGRAAKGYFQNLLLELVEVAR